MVNWAVDIRSSQARVEKEEKLAKSAPARTKELHRADPPELLFR